MADYELKDIRTDILEPSQTTPVVLDFWAPWCGPCKTLSPILEKLAAKARGKWKFVKVNVDEAGNQPLAGQFQIRSIPAVRMLFQGQVVGSFDGALPEAQVKQWLKENLPESDNDSDEDDDELSGVEKLIEQGEREKARIQAEKAYNQDKQNDELKIKLAMLLLPDDIETAEKLLDALSSPEKFEIEKESLQTTKTLKTISQKGEVPGESGKTAEQYITAAKAVFDHDYETAVKTFIDILMVNRSFHEDGARKACVALFKLLGDKHPVSQAWRRRFSMALY